MFDIVKKRALNENMIQLDILAPLVAKKCRAGQFIILRVDDRGERIPLTVADFDRAAGTVTIIFQVVGKTTLALAQLEAGDSLRDFVGPLGVASELEGLGRVAVVGGGAGCAIAWPQAKALFEQGARVDVIAGFRTKELVILEPEMAACGTLHMMTDDGSYGEKGFVTDKLRQLLESGEKFGAVIAIGPLVMMKFVSKLTKEFGVKTIVSMNSIMIDGTGMCGCCRVTVGGQMKFACVDGPDFDGHLVDYDEAIRRSRTYAAQERLAFEAHKCHLLEQAK